MSYAISVEDPTIVANMVYRNCTCLGCNSAWTEEFVLAGYDHLNMG